MSLTDKVLSNRKDFACFLSGLLKKSNIETNRLEACFGFVHNHLLITTLFTNKLLSIFFLSSQITDFCAVALNFGLNSEENRIN